MADITSGASTTNWDILNKGLAKQTLYDTTGRQCSLQNVPTFSSANTFTPGTTANSVVVLSGSATRVVRVHSVIFGISATAAASSQFAIQKYSTAPTGGVAVVTNGLPHNSNNTPTAICQYYTASPGTLGTLIGSITIVRFPVPPTIPATWTGACIVGGTELLPFMNNVVQPIVLRGTSEHIHISLGANPLAGQTHYFRIVWTEETV